MRKIMRISMALLLLLIALSPKGLEAKQVDIYDVVGATESNEIEEKAQKDVTEGKTEKEESPEPLERQGLEDSEEVLRDIRTMLLGILFATSWTAGAVTFSTFGKTFSRKL